MLSSKRRIAPPISTGQLLSFAQQQPLQLRQIDLDAAIADMTIRLNQMVGTEIRILRVPDYTVSVVTIDPVQLEKLIINAATNAREATTGRDTLTISTKTMGTEACLSISDTGAGINRAILNRVFDLFFTTKGLGKGVGLDLSQAYGFAAQSGGRLEIDSEVGHGTTVRLYLSLAVAHANTAPRAWRYCERERRGSDA